MTEPLTATYPCTVCQGTTRWLDQGPTADPAIWRCVTCWPATTPLTAVALRGEQQWQAEVARREKPMFRERKPRKQAA
jgi:hypothetical protein